MVTNSPTSSPSTPEADDDLAGFALPPKAVARVVPGVDDEIDPAAIALPGDVMAKAGTREIVNSVNVGRPGNSDWFWVYPDPAFRATCALFEPQVAGSGDRAKAHLMLPAVVATLGLGRGVKHVEIYVYITRHGVVGLWPISVPNDDRQNDWIDTARDAALNFAGRWINLRANMAAKRYDLSEPIDTLPPPAAPPFPLGKLLGIAFKGRVIGSVDHPAVRELLGKFN